MIQKRYNYPYYRKEPPQKFIPRRDLFPDAVVPMEREYSRPAAWVNTPQHNIQAGKDIPFKVQSGRKPQPVYSPMTPVKSGKKRSFNPGTIMLLFAGWLFLWPRLKKLGWFNDPRSLDMLLSLGPYLDEKEQDVVYTAAGVLEAFHTINDVINHTYHNRHKAAVMQVPSDPVFRKIEAMKAIKPHIKPDSRKHLDQVVNLYESMHKMQKNIAIYRNNRTLAAGEKMSSIESVNEILKVIKPILPREQRERAEKAAQLLKMVEAVSTAEKLNREATNGKTNKRSDNNDSVNIAKSDNTAGSDEQNDKIQKMMDSLSPMLSDEQKESMQMIMKMAQLLSQTDSSDDTDNEGK
ncbi:MAG TPA: hypothetical protein GX505_10550 [Clostridiales bacterium]|nr:hypothetical protein [Clostridiales bacterium]